MALYNVKYYFSYYADLDTRLPVGTQPDEHVVEILELDYLGMPEEILASQNPVSINYQNTGDKKLEAFRGSEITLNLIATENFQLEDLYTENERQFIIVDYRNGVSIGRWFIIPDGCQESFSYTPYTISVNGVDGLGVLKNLSFVRPDSNIWLGKYTFFDVIYNCLNRLGFDDLIINTCVNIYEVSMTQGDMYDPLEQCYVNAERFFKEDGYTPMTCQEVLLAVLSEWTACIIQSEGEWYIYRPNEAALNGTLVFRRYVDGVMSYNNATVTKDIDVVLGGESEGVVLAPLFHINRDQLKMIDRPYKNASIGYTYGVVSGNIINPNFLGFTTDPITSQGSFPDWNNSATPLTLDLDPLGGAMMGKTSTTPGIYEYIQNATPVTCALGDIFSATINYYNYASGGPRAFIILTGGGLTRYADANGAWSATPYLFIGDFFTTAYFEGSKILTLEATPFAGSIVFRLFEPEDSIISPPPPPDQVKVTYRRAELSPVLDPADAIGEIHTAEQTNDFTFVPEILRTFNGDNVSDQFVGGIYRADQTTLTTLWNRRGLSESALASPYAASKPFLRIAAEEIVRLYGGPFVRFEGSIFGYFNPLSRFEINLITGKFMPLSLTYDLQSNICKAVLGRVDNTEIAMDYTLAADYGDAQKVAIK